MAEQVVLDFAVVLDHEVAARADQTSDERGKHDLIGPVDRLPQLAQASGDDAASQEAERESDPERLDRDAEDDDFGLHRARSRAAYADSRAIDAAAASRRSCRAGLCDNQP